MSETLQALLDETNNLIQNNHFEKALIPLEKALEEDSENNEVLKNLGLCYYNLKNNTKAQEYFSKALKVNPEDATALYFSASINLLNMDNEKAKEQFEKVIKIRPEYKDAYKNLGIVCFNLKHNQEAVEVLEKGLEYAEDAPDYYRLLASAYIVTQENQKALELLEGLLSKPEVELSHEIYNLLGSAALGLKDNEKAKEYYFKALEMNPQNKIAYKALKILEQPDKELFKEYKELVDNKADAEDIIDVANILYEQNELNEAITLLEYAIQNGYKDPDIYYQLSIIHEEKGEVIKALQYLKQILTLQKPTKEVELKIAKLFMNINRMKEAFKLLDKLTKKYPYEPEVYYEYAMAYLIYDDKIKAEEYLKKVINMDSDDKLTALAHKDMGCIYIAQNQMPFAQEEFELAYEKAPEDDLICYEYASYYFISGNYEKALEYYLKALKINPYQDEYKVALALLYNNLKRPMDTINLLTPIMPKIHRMPKLAYPLAVAFYEIKKYDTALRLFLLYCEQTQDVEAFNYLALCYENLEKYQDAINITDKILKHYPENTNVLLIKARCLHGMKKSEEAEEIYLNILSKFSNFEDAIIELLNLYKDTNQIPKAQSLIVRLDEDNFSDKAVELFHSLK